jgi:glycerol-3-phosphate acyltransferase PlsX
MPEARSGGAPGHAAGAVRGAASVRGTVADRGEPVTIALDAMGGDNAPAQIVAGALDWAADAAAHHRLLLVGDEELVRGEVERQGGDPVRFEFVHAPERIGMGDDAARSVRRKRRSSIAVCASLVKEGTAQALVSAGNTGAVVAASQLTLRRLPGVERPAIATYVPTERGGCVLLDVGANSDCKPTHLVQFARMGVVYAHGILGRERPRVGLLNIGEESSKGNELSQAAHALLEQSELDFVGNVEGRDIFRGSADVVVCDGFTGNVLLKFSESIIELMSSMMRREIMGDLRSRIGALLVRPALRRFRKDLDYSEYGGAPLLGVNGVCFIAHGSSSPKAIKNAVRVAARWVEGRVNERLVEVLTAGGGDVATAGGAAVAGDGDVATAGGAHE